MHFLWSVLRIITLAYAGVSLCAQDGVSPQVISLPSGPGSIEGLGESFEPQRNTGTYHMRLPFALTQSRGLMPELEIVYNNGYPNDVLGIGWRLIIPHIQKQTDKGLPEYSGEDNNIDQSGEELVKLANGSYLAENEKYFKKYQYFEEGDYWLATSRDGTRHCFGKNENAKLLVPESETQISGTYIHFIEWSEDLNGNRVEYRYLKDGNRSYISEIEYNLHATEETNSYLIEFDYSDDRPDPILDYRGRFRMETNRRLESATLFYGERRIRHWNFGYHENADISQLKSFTVYGDERSAIGEGAQENIDYLPAMEFEYTPLALGVDSELKTVSGFSNLNALGKSTQLVDIDRNGLPDLLHERSGQYYSILNEGVQSGGTHAFADEQAMDQSSITLPSLSDNRNRIADLRGDGAVKLLVKDGNDFYYRDFISPIAFGEKQLFSVDEGLFPLDSEEVRLVDIDNDKAIDLLYSNNDTFRILLNRQDELGNQFYSQAPPPPVAGMTVANGWKLTDANGDRLLDFVKVRKRSNGSAEVTVYYNKGWGAFESSPVVFSGAAELGTRGAEGSYLSDINQDGLADLLYVGSRLVRVWLNTGRESWADVCEISSDSIGNRIPSFDANETFVGFADMNGNGSNDIVWIETGDTFFKYLELHPSPKPRLLNKLHNGIGRTYEFEYKSSVECMVQAVEAGAPWTSFIPFSMPLMLSVKDHDGQGHIYTTEYSYQNPYYEALEREFRGFEQSVVKELGNVGQGTSSLVVEYTYHTGRQVEALKGKEKSVVRRKESGDRFDLTSNQWTARVLPFDLDPLERNSISFAYIENQTVQHLEEPSGKTAVVTYREFDWDNYGNQILVKDFGRIEGDDLSVWDDERTTRTEYSASYSTGISNWILNLPLRHSIEDENGQLASKKEYYYDDEDFSGTNFGVVSKGNLTLCKSWVSFTPEYTIQSVRYKYDLFGNRVWLLDPLANLQNLESGHTRRIFYDNAVHSFPLREIIYTGNVEVPSLTLNAEYDLGLGVVTASFDYNTNRTTYRNDTFARVEAIIKPGDSEHYPTLQYDYVLNHQLNNGDVVNWIETKTRETTEGGTLDSRKFFDGLGRLIMTRSEGEFPGQVVVSETVEFNGRKERWKEYLPYFETDSDLSFKSPAFNTGYQEHEYDALLRGLKTWQPITPEAGVRVFSTYSYEPLSVLEQDEEQTNPSSKHYACGKRVVFDGLQDDEGNYRQRFIEEIVKIDESGVPTETHQTWRTEYRFDLLDNFSGYKDHLGNEKSLVWDALSRLAFVNDPDSGYKWWSYDDASNLVHTRDARGLEIAQAFDGANRLISEWYLAESESAEAQLNANDLWLNSPIDPTRAADVSYHYDVSSGALDQGAFWKPGNAEQIADVALEKEPFNHAYDIDDSGSVDVVDIVMAINNPGASKTIVAMNTKGRLAWVEDLSGEEHLSYDSRGRIEWQLKRIYDSPERNHLESFFYRKKHDSMDRVVKHVYPDGTFVDYGYNSRGLLESLTNAIESIDYNPSAQHSMIQLACGVVIESDYDHRLRMRTLTSQRTRDGIYLQNYTYIFDEVSNITQIVDGRLDEELSKIGSEIGISAAASLQFEDSHEYQYDSVYRLIQADNENTYGTIDYSYNSIGNLLTKEISGESLEETSTFSYGGILGPKDRAGRRANEPPGPHALSSISSTNSSEATSLVYDNNGNVESQGAETLVWDNKNRLSEFSDTERSANYLYDHANQRRLKHVTDGSQVDTVLSIDKTSELRNGKLVKYIYAGDYRIARSDISPTETASIAPQRYYLNNHLGSGSIALDADADVIEQQVYFPYGARRLSETASADVAHIDYGFTGKERDVESGLHYFGSRYYSADTTRYASVDPIFEKDIEVVLADPQLFNAYSQTRNNPVVYQDPNGELPFLVPVALFVAKEVASYAVSAAVDYAIAQAPQEYRGTLQLIRTGVEYSSLGKAGKKGLRHAYNAVSNPRSIKRSFNKATGGGIGQNSVNGARREAEVLKDLSNGKGQILEQRTIFGADGKRAIASDGRGRRLDAVRVENGVATQAVEVTSPSEALRSRKVRQVNRGDELIRNGGHVRGANGERIPFASGVLTEVITKD